ncbi:MAG: branched-chain amino acid ABC transporter permease [Clostridia bacterium]|nr:branched-chain amino acid ABC transporter permease [Clostridia bacterium]
MKIIEIIISGLNIGVIYAMIALGYTMVYGIAKLLNFAHGDIIMVGGYAICVFCAMSGSRTFFFVSIVAAVIICTVLGIVVERVAYRPLRGATPIAVLITAIGISYLLQSLAQIIFGSAQRYVTVPDLGKIMIGSLGIKWSTIITLAASVIVMVSLSLFVKYSRIGRAMIAVSEDRGASQLMGINVNIIITITFAIGSALAALAGLFYLLQSPYITNTFGAMPGIKAFTAAVIGGIGSIPGAMIGSLVLGLIESICDTIVPIAPYKDAIEFSILIIILLVKPTGLLGKVRREKV